MDNLFLNRMNSWQGIVKKKQETIFEISIGSLHYFEILLKIRFRYSPVFSDDPKSTQTASDLKKIIHSASFNDLEEKLYDPSINWTVVTHYSSNGYHSLIYPKEADTHCCLP